MAQRLLPVASVRFFHQGQKDPRLLYRPAAWYDILRESVGFGSISRDANGRSTLEWLEDSAGHCAGLVARATITPQNSTSSQFTTSGGTWADFIRPSGAPRKSWLVQTDNTANLVWAATSTYSLPANANVALRLILPDAPADHDATTYPPRVRVELGNGDWAVQTSAQDGTQLLRKISGTLVPVLDIPEPVAPAKSDGIEKTIVLRYHRGRLWISTDFGRSYVSYGMPDGSSVSVGASTITIRGQGGMALFRLDNLVFVNGTYESPTRSLIEPRTGSPTITGDSTVPSGTSLSFTDLGSAAGAVAQYRATFTIASSGSTPFACYTCPELYTVETTYAGTTSTPLGLYTTPFDRNLASIRIERPLELSGGTATITARVAPGTILNNVGAYDRQAVEIRLGWTYDDGSVLWWTVFTGYIAQLSTQQDGYGSELVTFRCDNLAAWLNEATWPPDLVRPLSGRTINAASDLILASEGLGTSYRSWHTAGEMTLQKGRAENPHELIRSGERKWETLARLQKIRGLEVGVLQNGTLQAVPAGYISGTTHLYRVEQPTTLEQMAETVGVEVDFQQRATAAYCSGEGPLGDTLTAAVIDSVAEGNPASPRFKPRRVAVLEELPGQVTAGVLALRAQAIASDGFPIRYAMQVGGFLNLDVARRDQVVVYDGGGHGIPDGTAHVVLTQTIDWDLGIYTGEWQASQVLGLRRLG